jgi:acid phosphatase type 7
MPRLFPTPGNHDYQADKIFPFYFLFFQNAGPPGLGYYAYEVGGWRVYALNSEIMTSEPTGAGPREMQLSWLEADLQAHAGTRCTMAYFHRPPFSSGRFASPAWVMPLFRKLYKHGVDLVATGHEHFFAALPPLTPDGVVDRSYGVPLLIAGTGGAVMFERPRTLKYGRDGEVVVERTPGVLRMTLTPGAFEWGFVPVDREATTAVGGGRCHDNPPGARG